MVLEVCASAVQLVCAPARSIWPTLASAASTLALFASANWGLESLLDEETFIWHLVTHMIMALAMPLLPLMVSFTNAAKVWSLKRAMQKSAVMTVLANNAQVGERSITILSSCPLYIQVPSSVLTSTENESLRTRGYKLVGEPKELCPLEWAPAIIGSTDVQLQADTAAQGDHDQKKYLQLEDEEVDGMKEREVVLRLGLAPEYRQLRFLRSRSRFQAVVITLQAGGYLLSVAQRLAQHLAVCPLEALLCLLSVIIMLQLLLELYSCSHFERPLLLRLNHRQFSQFWAAPRLEDTEISFNIPVTESISIFIISVLVALPFSALSIYYYVHYMHSCLACSVAALLFLLSLLLFVISHVTISFSDWEAPGWVMVFCSGIMFLSSMVLAVVSTAKDWELFHAPTNNSFSWILPHVSSQP